MQEVYRPCLMGALLSAQSALGSSISTDKGHKSSNGQTVIEFWFQQPPTSNLDERQLDATMDVETSTQPGLSSDPAAEVFVPAAQAEEGEQQVMPTESAAGAVESTLVADPIAGASSHGPVTVPRQPDVTTNFEYLEEYRNASSKYDKVINLFINKLGNKSTYKRNLEDLAKYFADQLPNLTHFMKERFHLQGETWQDVVAMISGVIDGDDTYNQSNFTLASVLSDILVARTRPRHELDEQQLRIAAEFSSPGKSKTKRRKK
jgi:hypothetical protein